MQPYVRIPLRLAKFLSQLAFSPLVAGSLFLALTYAPDQARDVLSKLPLSLADKLDGLRVVFGALFALGALRSSNALLNASAGNQWRLGPQPGWDDWSSEVAVVTGGCSGIGYEMVQKLAARGVRVAVLDIQEPPAGLVTEVSPTLATKEGQEKQGGGRTTAGGIVHFYRCDVTDSEAVAKAADLVRRELGHPTILVNNAGISGESSILRAPEALVQKVFQINCLAHWTLVREFVPRMVQMDRGHVVTVASVASYIALPNAAAYSATKAGALAFHEALTAELKHVYKAPGVVTTVVHPSFVHTPLVAAVAPKLQANGMALLTSEEVAEAALERVFSRKGGQVFIPDVASNLSGLRGWPTWVQEVVRDSIGKQSAKIIRK